MPTHFSKLEGSPSNRRREQRSRRFNTPKRIITHDGCVSSTTNAYKHKKLGVGLSPVGHGLTDVPQSIRVQNWRRLRQTQQESQQEEQQSRQRKELHYISTQSEERCSDRYSRLDNENTHPGHRSSYHNSVCGSRISAISSSCPAHDRLGHSRTSSSSLSNHRPNIRVATYHEKEGSNEQNKRFSHRRSSFPLLKDKYTYYDSRATSDLPNHQKDKTNRNSKPSLSVCSRSKASITSVDRKTSIAKQLSLSPRREEKSALKPMDCEGATLANSFTSRHEATLRGERAADTSNHFDNICDDSHTISCNENSNGIYYEVKYRAQKSIETKNDNEIVHTVVDNKPPMRWLCDVCKEARFDSYVEAFRHEIECKKRNKTLVEENNSYGEQEKNSNEYRSSPPGKEKQAWRRGQIKNQLKEMDLSSSSRPDGCNSATKGKMRSQASVASTATSTRWLCSVCKKVSFDHYSDACRHEKICQIRTEATADTREKNDEFKCDKSQYIHNQQWNNLFTQESRQEDNDTDDEDNNIGDRYNSFKERSRETNGHMNRSYSGIIDTTGKVLCDKYNAFNMDHYLDACSHEKIFRIRMEATADMREPKDANRGNLSRFFQNQQWNNPVIKKNRQEDNDDDNDTAGLYKNFDARIGETNGPMNWSYTGIIDTTGKVYSDHHSSFNTDHYTDACHPEKIYQIRMEATADMREQQDKNRRGNNPVTLESRQQDSNNNEENNNTGNVYKNFEARNGETNGPINRPYTEIIYTTRKVYGDRHKAFNRTAEQGLQNCHFYNNEESRSKGDAYDRYISLASQADDEKDRKRYVALAKQTREEEMSSHQREESSEERYVCLA
uniref:Uncharacterized protein n=1 Tax=Pseudo-nitzschia australis TaxID=44445 RepID=A0A7S4AIK7_9STRA